VTRFPERPEWLIVRNVEIEGPDLVADVLAREGVRWRLVDAFAGVPLPDTAADLGGIVLLGGPMGVYDAARYPVLAQERALARVAADRGLPVLGICLGAQLLASAFGATVHPGPEKEIGWAPIELTADGRDDPVLSHLAGAPPVFHLHGDTFDLPPTAVHLARSARYAQQAFRIGTRAYGLQFHLEFSAATIRRVMADAHNAADARGLGLDPAVVAAEAATRTPALETAARRAFTAFARLA
jgi:GMP synthase-like glutamine amidotransferase